MNEYRKALCWAAAMVGVAVAGALGIIDEASMTSLLVALPVAGWLALGRSRCVPRRSA
jgi:hypothetical protein